MNGVDNSDRPGNVGLFIAQVHASGAVEPATPARPAHSEQAMRVGIVKQDDLQKVKQQQEEPEPSESRQPQNMYFICSTALLHQGTSLVTVWKDRIYWLKEATSTPKLKVPLV